MATTSAGQAAVRGASADALAALAGELDAVAAQGDPATVGTQLFTVAAVLRSEPGLRRIATDVSVDGPAKQRLARSIFGSRLDDRTLVLVESAFGRRWTAPRDLADTLERLGEAAVVKSADDPERLGDELFAVERAIVENPGLRDALSDPTRSREDKAGLVDRLLGDRALPATLTLLKQSLAGSYRTVLVALTAYQKVAAAEHDQRVATVRVARRLSDPEVERLRSSLSRQYGRSLHLNVVVEPELLGGVRVEVGDEVIDGTVAARLDEARRRLAG